jgi:hypothetical protein
MWYWGVSVRCILWSNKTNIQRTSLSSRSAITARAPLLMASVDALFLVLRRALILQRVWGAGEITMGS